MAAPSFVKRPRADASMIAASLRPMLSKIDSDATVTEHNASTAVALVHYGGEQSRSGPCTSALDSVAGVSPRTMGIYSSLDES